MDDQLFVVTVCGAPHTFIKAANKPKAVEKWKIGLDDEVDWTNKPDFSVRLVDIPLLMLLAPEQFILSEDCGF